MGDMLTLIEKAQATVDEEKARELQDKMRRDAFTLDDFRNQLQQVRRMGSVGDLLKMIPGLSRMKELKDLSPDDKELKRVEAIIGSMTPGEREDASLINAGRRRRIALGSGTTVQDVNMLLKQYGELRKMMRMMQGKGMKGKLKKKLGLFGGRSPF
jgi:signal recognition particle subunit SRP54